MVLSPPAGTGLGNCLDIRTMKLPSRSSSAHTAVMNVMCNGALLLPGLFEIFFNKEFLYIIILTLDLNAGFLLPTEW